MFPSPKSVVKTAVLLFVLQRKSDFDLGEA